MNSLVKWIIGVFAALIVLVVIAMVCIPLFIDPNDYKDEITRKVQEQTGRELSIPGDIKMSISPSLKAVFTLGNVNLSSGKTFQDSKFFSSELVDIKLSLWPLISSKKIMVNSIVLKGVNINLVRNNSGGTNWSDLAGGSKETQKNKETPLAASSPPLAKPAQALPKIDIGGIKITDSNVTFIDQQAGRTIKLTNFNLNAGHIEENNPFPFDANFTISLKDGKNPLNATTGLNGKLTFDLARWLFTIDQLKLKTDITQAPIPVKLIGLEISAKADLDKSMVTVSNLLLTVDDTTIEGTAAITDLKKPSYKTVLHIDQLNLDRYKTDRKETTAEAAPPGESAPAATAVATPPQLKPQNRKADSQIIPADLLRGLTFDAEITIDKLIAAKLVTTNILVKATGKEGLIQLQPFSAELYQGTVTVNGDIDARPDIPTMKLTKAVRGVELGPLFMDMKGKEEIKGKADIKAVITTRGLTQKELIRNANGTMNLSLANGEIARLKIIDTIRMAKQLYEGVSGKSAATSAQNKTQSGRSTSFADLSASGIITNGIFKNDDLVAQSELMKVTGKGTLDLNTDQINYLLTIYLAKTLERDEEKDLVEMADTPIPYKVEGTFDNIKQSAVLKEVLKAGAIKLLSKELDKQLGGDESKDGAKKGESGSTEELINKGLKSLFGN